MSKAVLAILAKEIARDVDAETWQKASKPFRQGSVEVKYRHYVLKFTEEEIYKQLKNELTLLDTSNFAPGDRTDRVPDEALRKAAKVYHDTLMAGFNKEELKRAVEEGSGRYIAVTNNYGALSKDRMKPADNKAKEILNSYLGNLSFNSNKILVPDHTDAVADIRFSKALLFASKSVARGEAVAMGANPDEVSVNRINEIALGTLADLGNVEFNGTVPVNKTTRDLFVTTYGKITSKFTHNNTQKEFDLTVGYEVEVSSKEANRISGDLTDASTDIFRKAAEKLAGKTNWAAQKSSDSFVEATLKTFNNIGIKHGATGKIEKLNTASATVRESVKRTIKQTIREVKPRIVAHQTKGSTKPKVVTTGPRLSLSYIVNYINSRLPATVARNMGPDNLVNRTGRFAGSTKIVNARYTANNNISLGYGYQRSPYDVFDPTKGAKPWNIPSRDPNTLIKDSVREIAQELAIGRFYLRRA